MKGWQLGVLVLAAVGVALWFGVPYGRALKYQQACDKAVHALGRFPTAEQVLALSDRLKAEAQPQGIDPATVQVQLGLRSIDGGGAKIYYVRAEVRHDGRFHAHEQSVDGGKVNAAFLATLREGGAVFVSGVGTTFADAPPPDEDE
ncbi:MAG: hypothetical protein R3F62_05035 [Planctomycetota bacterium]